MRAKAQADGHQGVGVWKKVMSMPSQEEQDLDLDPAVLEPSLQSPHENQQQQQQRKLFNSQSNAKNERIDDGGDDEVGGGVSLSLSDQFRNMSFLPQFLTFSLFCLFVYLSNFVLDKQSPLLLLLAAGVASFQYHRRGGKFGGGR